jgi:hypothetical protein
VPVEPGTIKEYVLRLYPFANTFKPGHRLVVELSNDEPLADEHNSDATGRLSPAGRPPRHRQDLPRLRAPVPRVLPFTTRVTSDLE